MPFLAATLLYLNNRVTWTDAGAAQLLDRPTLLLVAILALFVVVGAQEVINAF